MPDGTIPVQISLRNSAGEEIDRANFQAPGSHTFCDLLPDTYAAHYALPQSFVISPNPSYHTLTAPQNDLEIAIRLQDLSSSRASSPQQSTSPSPLKLIISVAVGMTLLSDLSLVKGLFSSLSPNQSIRPQQSQSSSKSPTRETRKQSQTQTNQAALSSKVEARLRWCLQANLENLLEIPSLSSLIQSLEREDENSSAQFQTQTILLYKRVQQLRQTIEDCDPTLIQELMAAEDSRMQQELPQVSIRIEAEFVNVRVGPSLGSQVIEQVSLGTVIPLDLKTFAELSRQQRLAIEQRDGWYPVILPNRRRGYVYSRYASKFYD